MQGGWSWLELPREWRCHGKHESFESHDSHLCLAGWLPWVGQCLSDMIHYVYIYIYNLQCLFLCVYICLTDT